MKSENNNSQIFNVESRKTGLTLSSKDQIRRLDMEASSYNLSSENLMDQAGFKASRWLLNQFPPPYSFCVFCGPGHNGGDAWVTAYYLKKAGRQVEIFSCKSTNNLFNIKKNHALSLGLLPKKFNQWKSKKGQILIDALFGVGLTRPLEGEFKELVLKINLSQQIAVSLDLPSGLCADTGLLLNSAVKAKYSLCFTLAKPGLYLNEGPSHSGQIFIFEIGFPKELVNKICHSIYLVQKKDVAHLLPTYKDTANKTDRGWSLIVAGKKGMWGCGLLASQAAYTAGSGFVTWASNTYPYEKSIELPEALLGQLKDQELFNKKTALGIGPGLGFSKEVRNFIFNLKDCQIPTVLDADALTLIAQEKNFYLNKNFVFTPHAGELSVLLKVPSNKIEEDRIKYAKQAAQKYKTFLLLKGFYPVLSDGEKTYIIPTGNSALGKAGTGDVLTGIITGLMAQSLSPLQATLLGTILHGETAKRWIAQGKDINSFSASKIIKELPFVMKDIRCQTK